MEASGTGISRLDCYEDMFKEITRKLYGEDPDHRTSNVQNEFETSVTYKNDDDTGNGTDGSDDGNWTYEEEPLKGTDGSRIAAYHAGKTTWRCDECGDIITSGPREVAEHFVDHHSSRILMDNSRNRHHSPRKDYLQMDFKIEDLIMYLERLREHAERQAPPSRRTQETQTIPAALLPASSSFLLQELPSASTSHLQQNSATMAASPATSASGKRYSCPFCPYSTDRRDLYTRHENIHREDKPFFCYICLKPFNRADHVKKHFLRMHRDAVYDVTKIRRQGSSLPKPLQQDSGNTSAAAAAAAAAVVAAATAGTNQQQQPQQPHPNYQPSFASNKNYQLQPNTGQSNGTSAIGIYQTTTMVAPGIMQPDNNCNTGRRVQNGGCNSKSHLKSGSKGAQERKYNCVYCDWSGADNWCLKRHLNTHTKPFACSLCEYKAARAERLSTHVLKVHNKRQCSKCSYLAEDLAELNMHQHEHRVNNTSAPSMSSAPTILNASTASPLSTRHQQPLHPVGGRPPPGPPVFPAAIPPIAPATSVIPSTSYNPPFPYGPLGPIDDSSQEQALSLKISQYTAGQNEGYYENQENKENQAKQEKKEKYNALHQRRGRKQSRPKQVIWNRDTYGTPDSFGNVRTIPALGILQDITRDISQNVSQNVSQDIAQDISQDITQGITQNASQNISQAITQDIKPNITSDVKQEDPPLNSVLTKYDKTREKMTMLRKLILTRKLRQQLMRQRLFRCYLCGEDESARAKCRRPYHTKASLTLHKLWHKHKSHRLYRRSHRQTISNRVQGALLLGQAEGHLDRPTQDINIASNIQGREYRLPLSESQTFQTQLTFKCCSY